MSASKTKIISNWLFVTAFFVFCMAIIGAITRLTESGLSMVEWRPLIGTVPPLSQEEWQRVFDLYKQTPEYQKEHFWMGIDDFKYIFFWEWFHRFWGRLIGLIYALPLAFFWVKGWIPVSFKPKLLGLLALGAAQAVMGWYMVESGLVDMPSVSHYRLAAHLSLAFVIFAALVWVGLEMRDGQHVRLTNMSPLGAGSLVILSVTIIWGAYVAGLDAGLVYNTWPLMDDRLIPGESFAATSVLSDPVWVQFTHRWLAIIAAAVTLAYAWRVKSAVLAAAIVFQIVLGIATLLSQVWIPLAALHQAGAFIVVLAFLHNAYHQSKKTV